MEPKKIIQIKPGEEKKCRPPPKKAPPTARFIIQYALILLSVAFVLVLLSYLSHQQQWADIQAEQSQFSVSALRSIQSLQEEVQSLQEESARLEGELEQTRQTLNAARDDMAAARADISEAEAQNQTLRDSLEHAENTAAGDAIMAENQRLAMDYLWRVEALLSAKKTQAARELLAEMMDKDLRAYLPDHIPEGVEETTAAEEYDRLTALLIK